MLKNILIICTLLTLTGCSIYSDRNLNIYNPDRITKKSFGTYVEPGNSPVDPEVFRGYHTALDFETFDNEQDIEIPVYAICRGPLLLNRWAQGYGGVIVQSCKISNEDVTVIYGHIDLESVPADKVEFEFGDFVGNLGDGYTNETDNERKHLHLGVHKGTDLNLLGYVQDSKQLEEWMDPWELLSLEIEN